MSKGDLLEQSFIGADQYAIQYTDDTGDVINVSDDEDLISAYEVAESALGGNLKFEIRPRGQNASAFNQSKIFQDDQISLARSEMVNAVEPQMLIRSSYIKGAINDAFNQKEESDKEMDDGSDSEEDQIASDQKGKGHKKNRGNREKKLDKNTGLPRKAFKRLIKKELDKQCQDIFNNLFNVE